jgi:NAD(P)H dehydrogenase (quinone)
MTQFKNDTILVTGASGQFGRLVLDELLAKGASKIVAGTRAPDKLAAYSAKGVDVRALDFEKTDTLASAFAGVDRVLIISTDSVGSRFAQHQAAIAAAQEAGVKHIVYTSAPAARPDSNAGVAPEHFWTEVAIANTGIDFTILRNHMYAQNNLMDAGHVVSSGTLYGLIGDRGTSYVWREDAARTAAGALLCATGKTIEDVSGPAPISNEMRAALYSKVAGKPIKAVAVSEADLKAGMVAGGVPAGFADVLLAFQRDAVLGHYGVVSDTVEKYSGRKPASFETFVEANAAAFKG